MDEQPILRYDNLVASPRGLTETERGKVLVFAPASEIVGVSLRFGRSGHNFILVMTIGIALVAGGIFGFVTLVRSSAAFRYALGLVAFGLVGGSVIFDALKSRYFLEVRLN